MALSSVQPWGTSPTPLLPAALIVELGHLSAPLSLRQNLGKNCTLAELNGDIWASIGSVSMDCLRELVDILRPRLPSLGHLVIRSGQPLAYPVQYFPLSTRTRNLVSQYTEEFSATQLSFQDILSVPSCGVRSTIEFACILEASMNCKEPEHYEAPSTATLLQSTGHVSAISEIKSAFQMLAAYATGERNLDTLSSVMPAAPLEWPPEIKQLWGNLGDLRTEELAGDLVSRYSVPKLLARAMMPITDRLRGILADRVFVTGRAVTLEIIGEREGITRERVRQIEKKAIAHLKRLHNAESRPIIRRSKALRERLGAAVPVSASSIDEALIWTTEDFPTTGEVDPSFARALLLWLAGPYKARGDWLLADKHLPRLTLGALVDCRTENGLISDDAITEVLTRFEILERYHQEWLNRLRSFLRVDGGVIYFKGTILEKIRALIRYHNRPLTVEEMLEDIGSGSVRSVRQRLVDDPGFWRINKQNQFVIAETPGYDEYTGITDEIIQELEASGGQASFDHLVTKLSRIYGVKESSVAAYLNTPMFTKDDNGIVRVRDAGEGIDVSTDITKTAACYCTHEGTWYWRVQVDKDMARGSGRLIPNAFAQQLGCSVGDKVEVESECGPITLSWPLTSTTGAYIGSLRRALSHYDAEIEDFLFIRAANPEMTFELLRKRSLDEAATDLSKVALLLGCGPTPSDSEALDAITSLLGISSSTDEERHIESRRLLQARGETELAEMIPSPTLSVDDYISNMGKLFDR